MPLPVPPAGAYGPNLPHPGSAAAKAGPTPAGFIYALRRRWVLATFLGGLVSALAAFTAWMLMPGGKHTVRALIEVKTSNTDFGAHAAEDFDSFRRSQMVFVKTRDLINRTLAEPKVASLDMIKNAEDPVRMLEEGVKVDASAAPTILTVSLAGDNPDDLKVILETLLHKYLDETNEFDRKVRDEQVRRLELQAEKFRAEIQSKDKQITLEVAASGGSTGGPGADTANAVRLGYLTQLERDVLNLQKEIEHYRAVAETIKKRLSDPSRIVTLNPLEVDYYVERDSRMYELLRKKAMKEASLAEAKQVAENENAPSILGLKTAIDQLDTQIAQTRKEVEPDIRKRMIKFNEQELRAEIANLEDKQAAASILMGVNETIRDRFREKSVSAAQSGLNTSNLLKELDPLRELVAKIESRRWQLQVEKNMDARVRLRESPVVIMNQNLKQKTIMAVVAGIVGFFGVLVVIGFLEWRTRRIDGVDQVVNEIGMRVIGTVPAFPNKASLKAAEAAGNANWRFVLNEAINSTRTMLLHTARSQSMQVVMVTSATQGEGKTSLASQLGTSMAAAGMRTLIVDCDLRNPSIHKLFELELSVGVSEVLCQEADVTDAVQPTAVPNLWIIPAGRCSNRVITALAQGHPLETLFNRLRGQFDFIVVDCCPVLPVADALLIGQHVDGVVFSIMQDISQLPKVLVASEKLHQLNIPLLGAVVNGVSAGSAYYAYGYNYVKQLPA